MIIDLIPNWNTFERRSEHEVSRTSTVTLWSKEKRVAIVLRIPYRIRWERKISRQLDHFKEIEDKIPNLPRKNFQFLPKLQNLMMHLTHKTQTCEIKKKKSFRASSRIRNNTQILYIRIMRYAEITVTHQLLLENQAVYIGSHITRRYYYMLQLLHTYAIQQNILFIRIIYETFNIT